MEVPGAALLRLVIVAAGARSLLHELTAADDLVGVHVVFASDVQIDSRVGLLG